PPRVGTSVSPDATAEYDAEVGRNWLNQSISPLVAKYPMPEQAYDAIGSARMCTKSATIDQTETWLATTTILGGFVLQAHCTDGRAPVAWAVFVRTPEGPGACDRWSNIEGSYYVSRPLPGETIPANARATVPSWLTLPSGQYQYAHFAENGSYDSSIRFG